MAFSVFHGVNPLNEVKKLNKMCHNGEISTLVLGGRKYGSYKWVITCISNTLSKYDNAGNCWAATADVTLKEYPKR